MNDTVENSVVLSFDIDWALDEVVQDTLALLQSANMPAIFFCTHRPGDELFRKLQRGPHEIGLHPHVGDDNDLSLANSLDRLCQSYPDAVAARSHSLLCSTPILRSYKTRGIRYSSNVLARRTPGLRPLPVQWGIHELPIYEMDYFLLAENESQFAEQPSDLHLKGPGLKVFCFHPIHLFLNCRSLDDYENARPAFQEYDELSTHRQSGYGMRGYFRKLLSQISTLNLPVRTLADITEIYDLDDHG